MKDVALFLSEEEAKMFISFQKNRKLFDMLDKEKALGLSNSSIEIHFDVEGNVRVINLHKTVRL